MGTGLKSFYAWHCEGMAEEFVLLRERAEEFVILRERSDRRISRLRFVPIIRFDLERQKISALPVKTIDSSSADCPVVTDKLSWRPPQNDTKAVLISSE
jgi:hypothetical protein